MTYTLLLLSAGACGATMKPPATNSGPALSSTGVQVTVVRQSCTPLQPFGPLWEWVEQAVEIQVRNGSLEPVHVYSDRFRLTGSDGSIFGTSQATSPSPLVVGKGETQTLEVTFAARAGLECSKPMWLDPSAGITSRDSSVVLAPIHFVPSRAL
jgi:hypothetical protein